MRTNAKVWLSVVAIIVIVAAVWGVSYLIKPTKKAPSDAVAQVGSTYITKDQLAKATAQGASKSDALDCLMRYSLYQQIALNNKANVSQDTMDSAMVALGIDPTKATAYQVACVGADQYQLADEAYYAGSTSGKLVITRFDQNIPSIHSKGRPVNTAQAAADKTYATNLINKLYTAVTTGKMTMDAAVAAETNDSYLGANVLQTSVHSGSFSTTEDPATPLDNLVTNQSDLLASIEKTAVNSYTTVQTVTSTEPGGSPEPIAFAFAQVTASMKTHGSLTDAVTKIKDLGYKELKQ